MLPCVRGKEFGASVTGVSPLVPLVPTLPPEGLGEGIPPSIAQTCLNPSVVKSRGLRPSRTSVISRQAGSCIAR